MMPNERTAITSYNAMGQVRFKEQTGQFDDLHTSVCYDELGREIEKTTPHCAGDANIKTAVVEYDEYGRLRKRTIMPIEFETDIVFALEVDGHATTISNDAIGFRTSKTDLTGRVVETEDPGGTLTRTYQSGGLLKKVELNNVQVVENTYDEFGRQIKLDDMNAGATFYHYDSFDNLIFQQDANGNILKTKYDELGRIETRTVSEVGENNGDPLGSYDYEYYTEGPEETLLKKETAPSGHATEYTYDDDQNIQSITEIIEGQPYTTSFEYDEFGKPTRKEFPSGFAIRYQYDSKAYLERVVSDDGQLIIWEITNGNAQGQVTNYNLGNGLVIENDYDDDYFPKSTTAENGGNTVFSFEYDFDAVTGNLKSRNLHGTEEHFFYDTGGLNRLTGTGPDENTVGETYSFADNGNIEIKEGVGEYIYHPQKKNAVSQIDFGGGVDESGLFEISDIQNVTYNHFNSASAIKNLDNDLKLELEYGPDDQRRKAVYTDDGDALKTRIYAGSYEKQTDDNSGATLEVHYISAGGMLVAMYVIDSNEVPESGEGPGRMYYPHLDHLGSIIHISDASGEIVETFSYDAWGRPRNPDDLSYNSIPERPDWLWRGYTGHEHLDEFGLINMNGRLYDPVVGRMLSPDNYVQSPDFSQSYNRYSYVWNNPLKYNDPSGEFVNVIIGAAFGLAGGYATGRSLGLSGWDLFGYTLLNGAIGAVTSGVGGAVGAGVSGAVSSTTAIGGAGVGALAGAVGGAAGGFVGGMFTTALNNQYFGTNHDIILGGFLGAAGGAAVGGIVGGISGAAEAVSNDRHWFTGEKPYFEGRLDGYELSYQNDMYEKDPKMCKDAQLESIEKLNGGTRTQEQFHREGLQRIAYNDQMTLDEYFSAAGFETIDPKMNKIYIEDIGGHLNKGNPTVITKKTSSGSHTQTITRVRQWTHKSPIKVRLADPTKGYINVKWQSISHRNQYLFMLNP